jgi:hypothetical protein
MLEKCVIHCNEITLFPLIIQRSNAVLSKIHSCQDDDSEGAMTNASESKSE